MLVPQRHASGIVLRGGGSGTSPAANTVVIYCDRRVAASTSYPPIVLGSSSSAPAYASGAIASATGSYVPAAGLPLEVSNVAGNSVEENVLVKRPATANWINLMGMNSTSSLLDTVAAHAAGSASRPRRSRPIA